MYRGNSLPRARGDNHRTPTRGTPNSRARRNGETSAEPRGRTRLRHEGLPSLPDVIPGSLSEWSSGEEKPLGDRVLTGSSSSDSDDVSTPSGFTPPEATRSAQMPPKLSWEAYMAARARSSGGSPAQRKDTSGAPQQSASDSDPSQPDQPVKFKLDTAALEDPFGPETSKRTYTALEYVNAHNTGYNKGYETGWYDAIFEHAMKSWQEGFEAGAAGANARCQEEHGDGSGPPTDAPAAPEFVPADVMKIVTKRLTTGAGTGPPRLHVSNPAPRPKADPSNRSADGLGLGITLRELQRSTDDDAYWWDRKKSWDREDPKGHWRPDPSKTVLENLNNSASTDPIEQRPFGYIRMVSNQPRIVKKQVQQAVADIVNDPSRPARGSPSPDFDIYPDYGRTTPEVPDVSGTRPPAPPTWRQTPDRFSFHELIKDPSITVQEAYPNTINFLTLLNPDTFQLPWTSKVIAARTHLINNMYMAIHYSVWANNKASVDDRVMDIWNKREPGERIFLLASVNGTSKYCGLAEVMGPADMDLEPEGWKHEVPGLRMRGWPIRWLYVKDVPFAQFSHIRQKTGVPVANMWNGMLLEPTVARETIRTYVRCPHFENLLARTSSNKDGPVVFPKETFRRPGTVRKSTMGEPLPGDEELFASAEWREWLDSAMASEDAPAPEGSLEYTTGEPVMDKAPNRAPRPY